MGNLCPFESETAMQLRFSGKSARSKMAAMEVSACSPHKVPQSLINNVLAICPDADPKDVAKDLVITGSATRTINRILDGQVCMKTNVG